MNHSGFHIVVEPFSAGYDLVQNASIETYDDNVAIMDVEMFESLQRQFGPGFIGLVGGLHYQFKPMRSIPTGSVAVPERNHTDPSTLLIQK